jgi:hypothetical protein
VLEFSYYQEWNDMRGTARLTLAPDGALLSGTWVQADSEGTWTLRRQAISAAEISQALAALPERAAVSTSGAAPQRGTASARCQRNGGGSGFVCQTALRAPSNAAPGSDVDITRETLHGNDVQVERWTCRPAQPGLVLDCAVTTVGSIMQGGQVTVTFPLANGEQQVLSYEGACDTPTPPRTACR